MRFLADMEISPKVVELLRSQGHDALHLHEEGLEMSAPSLRSPGPLFGTDTCFADASGRMWQLGYLKGMLGGGKLSQGGYEKIAGGNARRVRG